MYVVQHEFLDKYTGQPVKVGTIVEIPEGERKNYLLDNQIIVEAKTVKLEDKTDKTVKAGAKKK